MKAGIRRVSVRYNEAEDEWEMRCDSCASAGQTKAWWPLTLEFWAPDSGLQRCRACNRLADRLRRRKTPAERRAKQRAYYIRTRPERLAIRSAYREANRDEINRRRREKYTAQRGELNEGIGSGRQQVSCR